MTFETKDVLAIVAGTGVLGMLARYGLTWLGRQGLIQSGDNSQKSLIEALSAEAMRWKELHEAMRIQHEENLELLTTLRVQNAMLRMMLRQHGVPMVLLDQMEQDLSIIDHETIERRSGERRNLLGE